MDFHLILELVQLVLDLLGQQRRQLVTRCGFWMSVVFLAVIGVVQDDS